MNYRISKLFRRIEYGKKAKLHYPPNSITIGVTSACRYNCLFCAYHAKEAVGKSNVYGLPYMLTLEKFKKIVDMAKTGGVPRIHICGTGEPFLNPQMFEMIDYAAYRYGETSFQTDFCKDLFERDSILKGIIERKDKINYITTDICSGIATEHERIKKGSDFRYLMNSLRYLGDNSNIRLHGFCILTKDNYLSMKGIIDTIVENEIKNFDLSIGNLYPYDFSQYTSTENVYTSKDVYITDELRVIAKYGKEKGIKVSIPLPADLRTDKCDVFWNKFQTWPVQGCDQSRYAENMIPFACPAVVKGNLKTLGYILDYDNIMEAWNSPELIQIRKNLIRGKYPDEACKRCFDCNLPDQIFKNNYKDGGQSGQKIQSC